MNGLVNGWKRTNYCANFSTGDVGKAVTLMGWVQTRRDFGALVFIDLRDRTGIMQVVFDESILQDDFLTASGLRSEYVIAVYGKIVLRDKETINEKLPTGLIEVKAQRIKVLNSAQTPPFEIEDETAVREELRLKYRYLDLRRPVMQKNMLVRSKIATAAREYLEQNGFIDIETPMLTKSTPEGARDYLVPSRIHQGSFYALPQSPQVLKQMLMLSGFDRYFQIVKCFRDEDLRADRQPEFTQIDIEMSFIDVDDIIAANEGLIAHIFKQVLDIDINLPFKRLTYKEAMNRYGSDKPDTRFGLELKDVSDIVAGTEFTVFSSVIKKGGSVRAINVKGAVEKFARREIDSLVDFVKIYGAKGMAWMSMKEDGIQSPITKFLTEQELMALIERTEAKTGDIIFFVGDKDKIVFDALGNLRLKIAQKLSLIDKNKYDLLWVVDFPLFEYSEEEKRYTAMHHPFTCPKDEDIDILLTEPANAHAKAYDIVLNGNEIGGGSIRIHTSSLQQKMLEALGFSQQQAEDSFGFLLEALKYGAPPHGGIAFGLDRLAMLLLGAKSIRDVIAFPKVQNASCLLTMAPTPVPEKQLKELGLKLNK